VREVHRVPVPAEAASAAALSAAVYGVVEADALVAADVEAALLAVAVNV
jgi:hypothetical protein